MLPSELPSYIITILQKIKDNQAVYNVYITCVYLYLSGGGGNKVPGVYTKFLASPSPPPLMESCLRASTYIIVHYSRNFSLEKLLTTGSGQGWPGYPVPGLIEKKIRLLRNVNRIWISGFTICLYFCLKIHNEYTPNNTTTYSYLYYSYSYTLLYIRI